MDRYQKETIWMYGDQGERVLARYPVGKDGPAYAIATKVERPTAARLLLLSGIAVCVVGLKVVGLKRIRIGRVTLGNLPVGQWRYLSPNERF